MAGMRTRWFSITSIAAALLLFLSFVAAAQTYRVRLTRPWRVGDRYRISATGWTAQESSTTTSRHTLEKAVKFLAEGTVLEVRRDGRIATESLTIDECLASSGGRAQRLVPRGAVVVVSAEHGKQVFRMNGSTVSSEIDDVLSMIVSIEAGETSNDDVFGTPRLRRVGETWAVNAPSAVRWLREAHLYVNQEDIKGSASAMKRVVAENEDCLVIDASLVTDKLSGDVNGRKVQAGRVEVNVTGTFPINTSRHCVEQSQHITIHLLSEGNSAPGSTDRGIDFKSELQMTAYYTLL